MVEHSAVNRRVVGSSPTLRARSNKPRMLRGFLFTAVICKCIFYDIYPYALLKIML